MEPDGYTSPETGKPPRAYLWVPPACRRLRGVVLGQHNMLEEPLFGRPEFRDELAKADLAIIWITPWLGGQKAFGAAEKKLFGGLLAKLAAESGYSELATVPIGWIGHSALADFPYFAVSAWPERSFCGVSIKGSWADMKRQCANDLGRTMAGVPFMLLDGEYEDADGRAGRSLGFVRAYPAIPFTFAAEAGAGHFDWSPELARYVGLYFRKAALARRPVDPLRTGWLMERWHADRAPSAAPAPVAAFTGDRAQAYWYFDGEHAAATLAMQERYRSGRKIQLLGFRQDGAVLPQDPKQHLQVIIPFKPIPEGDGLTFRLAPCFLDAVPPGRPVGWSGLPAGSPIAHSAATNSLAIRKISGPVEQIGKDLFAVRFDRIGFEGYRAREFVLFAEAPGDGAYQRMVQQALLRIPLPNKEGPEQTITFPPVGDLRRNAGPVRLRATASSGLPVRYYVREGPATVSEDGVLALEPIPPRARFPVKVTVCAWQWGRSIDPKVRTAAPVYQTILVR